MKKDKNNEKGQILWIILNNQRIQFCSGALFAPQESRNKKNELIKIYKS